MRVVRVSRSPVLAVLVSDIHLSMTAPPVRAGEADWFAAMRRVLNQIKRLVDRHKAILIVAGDVFDKWNVPSELVNWALDHLPRAPIYGVPGNHDLPSHRLDLSHRSAWGTLVRSKRVVELGPEPLPVGHLVLYGRPFNGPIPERADSTDLCLHVLVTHEYVWVPGCTYVGAPKASRLCRRAHRFRNFDVVVVGDNHAAFVRKLDGPHPTWISNCGTPMRRKVSEAHYTPSVGLIHENGVVSRHYLDTSGDSFDLAVTAKQEIEHDTAGDDFVDGVRKLEAGALDFRDSVRRGLKRKRVGKLATELVLEAME